jgi:hypothetical protein
MKNPSPIQTAIQLSVEGGWRKDKHPKIDVGPDGWVGITYGGDPFKDEWCGDHVFVEEMFLDPAFWQCLGKKMGWFSHREEWSDYGHLTGAGEPFMGGLLEYPYQEGGTLSWTTKEKWRYEMHAFIDHLASGQTPESFFTNLLAGVEGQM